MTEQQFWQLVTLERQLVNDESASERLKAKLSALSNEELAQFDKFFTLQMRRLFRWDLWGAAFVIAGCNNECDFAEFRCWLIAQGQTVVDAACDTPDSLAAYEHMPIQDGLAQPYFDDYDLVAGLLYEARTGEELPFFPSDTQPEGKKFKDKTKFLKQSYPQLFTKYWQS